MKPIRAKALKRIQRWSLSLYSQHTRKEGAHREVTNLHLDHHLLSGFTASDVYVCFHFAKKKKSYY